MIREDPLLAQIPVIAITSFALSGDERLALEAGCNAYVAKPFRPRDLLEMIQRFLTP
jgi:two-component system cell cycle response regulator DivK